MKKAPNYEEAVSQLEEIVQKAQQLIKLCKDKLTKTDEEIKKILESGK